MPILRIPSEIPLGTIGQPGAGIDRGRSDEGGTVRRFCFAVIVCVSLGLATQGSSAGAKTQGVRAATAPIMRHITEISPRSIGRFVNCPAENKVPLGDGSTGLGCEFRFVKDNATIRGSATVARERRRWVATYFRAFRPLPQHWKSCNVGVLKGLPSSTPRRLEVFGVSCQDAKMMASTIQFRASSASNLRIPRHFTEGRYGTMTLGFVTNTFQCRGKVEVRQGDPNPYGRETARCRTRFGDRFLYVFDQGS